MVIKRCLSGVWRALSMKFFYYQGLTPVESLYPDPCATLGLHSQFILIQPLFHSYFSLISPLFHSYYTLISPSFHPNFSFITSHFRTSIPSIFPNKSDFLTVSSVPIDCDSVKSRLLIGWLMNYLFNTVFNSVVLFFLLPVNLKCWILFKIRF